MAEPEDVEEDLFADLYDADESANQPPPAVEPPRASEPVATPIPAQPPVQTQAFHTGTDDVRTVGQQHDGGYQNGTGNVSDFANHSATPVSGESEPQGTGIKEDG